MKTIKRTFSSPPRGNPKCLLGMFDSTPEQKKPTNPDKSSATPECFGDNSVPHAVKIRLSLLLDSPDSPTGRVSPIGSPPTPKKLFESPPKRARDLFQDLGSEYPQKSTKRGLLDSPSSCHKFAQGSQPFHDPLPSTPKRNTSSASGNEVQATPHGPSRFQDSPQGNDKRLRACPVAPRLKPPQKLKKGGEQLKLAGEILELSGGQAKNSVLMFTTPEGRRAVFKNEPKGKGRGAVNMYEKWYALLQEHGHEALRTIELLGYEETKDAVLSWYDFSPHSHPVKSCTALGDLPKLCLDTLAAMELWKGSLTHHDIKPENLFVQDSHTVRFLDFGNNGFCGGLGDMSCLNEDTKKLVLSADDCDDYDQIWWVMFVTTFMAGLDHEAALEFVRKENGFDAFPTVRARILDPTYRKPANESKDFDFPVVD